MLTVRHRLNVLGHGARARSRHELNDECGLHNYGKQQAPDEPPSATADIMEAAHLRKEGGNNPLYAASGIDWVMPTPGLCRVLGANKKISGESRLLVIGLSALSKALKEGEQGVCGLVPGRHETARLGARGVASAPVERFKNSAITLSSRPAKPMFCCVIQSAKAVKIRRLAFSDWGA